jgi:hypothetical protein
LMSHERGSLLHNQALQQQPGYVCRHREWVQQGRTRTFGMLVGWSM